MYVVVCEASPGILKGRKTHVAEFMFVLLHVHLHTVLHLFFFTVISMHYMVFWRLACDVKGAQDHVSCLFDFELGPVAMCQSTTELNQGL